MINLLHFLNDYEENIEVLQKHKTLKRMWGVWQILMEILIW
jgi:hypothetical protein